MAVHPEADAPEPYAGDVVTVYARVWNAWRKGKTMVSIRNTTEIPKFI